jgi:hypothetical protein
MNAGRRDDTNDLLWRRTLALKFRNFFIPWCSTAAPALVRCAGDPLAVAATAGGGNSQNISFNGIMIGTTAFFNQFAAQIARTQQQYAQLNLSLA